MDQPERERRAVKPMVSAGENPGDKETDGQAPVPDAPAGEDAESDNPLAHVDPDQASPSSGQGMFNDPEADLLWNPSSEPDEAADTRAQAGSSRDGNGAEDADTPEPRDNG
ncbi:MAG: hypothetical protein ACHP7K_09310 [Actinomycetales bacterium]